MLKEFLGWVFGDVTRKERYDNGCTHPQESLDIAVTTAITNALRHVAGVQNIQVSFDTLGPMGGRSHRVRVLARGPRGHIRTLYVNVYGGRESTPVTVYDLRAPYAGAEAGRRFDP